MEDVDSLLKTYRKKHLVPEDQRPMNFGELGAELPARLLPHRGPMLLVDDLLGVDVEAGVAFGRRHIHEDHVGLAGHFPGMPILPGTVQIEMLGQLGLCMHRFLEQGDLNTEADFGEMTIRATKILGAQFVAEIRPGDDVDLVARRLYVDDFMGTCIAQALVGDKICSVMIGEVIFL